MSIGHCRFRWFFISTVLLISSVAWAQPSVDVLNDAYDRLVALDEATLSLPRKDRLQRLADAYNAALRRYSTLHALPTSPGRAWKHCRGQASALPITLTTSAICSK